MFPQGQRSSWSPAFFPALMSSWGWGTSLRPTFDRHPGPCLPDSLPSWPRGPAAPRSACGKVTPAHPSWAGGAAARPAPGPCYLRHLLRSCHVLGMACRSSLSSLGVGGGGLGICASSMLRSLFACAGTQVALPLLPLSLLLLLVLQSPLLGQAGQRRLALPATGHAGQLCALPGSLICGPLPRHLNVIF